MQENPRHFGQPANLSLIGSALKQERIALGLTQKKAAEQFQISLKALRNLEQGKEGVTLSTLVKILRYFGRELRVGEIVMSPRRSPASRPRPHQILRELRLVKPVLEKKFGVKSVALFGSCARDEATKKSDVDIAVTFRNPPTFSLLGRLTVFLETIFEGRKVDLVEEEKMIAAVAHNAKKDFIYV